MRMQVSDGTEAITNVKWKRSQDVRWWLRDANQSNKVEKFVFLLFFLKISCCRNRLKPHSVIHIPDVFSTIVRYERNYTAKNDLKRCKKKCPRPGLNE